MCIYHIAQMVQHVFNLTQVRVAETLTSILQTYKYRLSSNKRDEAGMLLAQVKLGSIEQESDLKRVFVCITRRWLYQNIVMQGLIAVWY